MREALRWIAALAAVLLVASTFEGEEYLDDHQERTIWEVERRPATLRF